MEVTFLLLARVESPLLTKIMTGCRANVARILIQRGYSSVKRRRASVRTAYVPPIGTSSEGSWLKIKEIPGGMAIRVILKKLKLQLSDTKGVKLDLPFTYTVPRLSWIHASSLPWRRLAVHRSMRNDIGM